MYMGISEVMRRKCEHIYILHLCKNVMPLLNGTGDSQPIFTHINLSITHIYIYIYIYIYSAHSLTHFYIWDMRVRLCVFVCREISTPLENYQISQNGREKGMPFIIIKQLKKKFFLMKIRFYALLPLILLKHQDFIKVNRHKCVLMQIQKETVQVCKKKKQKNHSNQVSKTNSTYSFSLFFKWQQNLSWAH